MMWRSFFPKAAGLVVAAMFATVTAPAIAHAQTVLAEFEAGELSYLFIGGEMQYRIAVSKKLGQDARQKALKPEVFALENPTRLVIDLPGYASKSARTISLSHDKFSALRLGTHPDKTRLVLDIKEAIQPSFTTSTDPELGVAAVDFNFLGEATSVPAAERAVDASAKDAGPGESAQQDAGAPSRELAEAPSPKEPARVSATFSWEDTPDPDTIKRELAALTSANADDEEGAARIERQTLTQTTADVDSPQAGTETPPVRAVETDAPTPDVTAALTAPSPEQAADPAASAPLTQLTGDILTSPPGQANTDSRKALIAAILADGESSYEGADAAAGGSVSRDAKPSTPAAERAVAPDARAMLTQLSPGPKDFSPTRGGGALKGVTVTADGVITHVGTPDSPAQAAEPASGPDVTALLDAAEGQTKDLTEEEKVLLAKVKAINYTITKQGGVSSVMIEVDGLNDYSFSKAGERRYLLTIKDATFADESLQAPLFAPPMVIGYEVIVPKQFDKSVIMEIDVEENVELTPFKTQGRLWLKAKQA